MTSTISNNHLREKALYCADDQYRNEYFLPAISSLHQFHLLNSDFYQKIVLKLFGSNHDFVRVEDLPFLPVQLFKERDIRSIPIENVYRTLKSSGTSSGNTSIIALDKETAQHQSKSLIEIVSHELGKQRLPMVIVDTPQSSNRNETYSAREAAVLGFSQFGSEKCFVLQDNQDVNFDVLFSFLDRHKGKKILFFGFTFLIWEFMDKIARQEKELRLDNSILIHGGGWKKLANLQISKSLFAETAKNTLGCFRTIDYYGMAEQVGSIFMECESGFFHTTKFSDLVVRDMITLNPLGIGQEGIIQLLSLIPKSYPGHSILTEDIGEIRGIDSCKCGRLGKFFQVLGRIPKAQIRGCSDTFS